MATKVTIEGRVEAGAARPAPSVGIPRGAQVHRSRETVQSAEKSRKSVACNTLCVLVETNELRMETSPVVCCIGGRSTSPEAGTLRTVSSRCCTVGLFTKNTKTPGIAS